MATQSKPGAYAHENASRALNGLAGNGDVRSRLDASLNGFARMGGQLRPLQDRFLKLVSDRIQRRNELSDEECANTEADARLLCEDIMSFTDL